ncbi:MAG TPA: amidohydrolase family protein [Polyangiaceae bacterium]|nr:amidohydrolase family protein [Polyangiaceae bacterium]
MGLIAIEEHWTAPQLTRALESLPPEDRDDSLLFNGGDKLARLEDLGETRIAAMDAQGIELSILGLAPPATGPLRPADAATLSRELNDLAAAAVKRHPTRLRALATLPMADPRAVAAELERAAGLGAVGAMVYGRTGDIPLDDPRYDDLFAAAAALRQPIFIHPQIPTRAVRSASYSGLGAMTELALATFAWGWHLEAGLAALRLIARGTFDRHPQLQIILGHWGELLLFWLDRANSLTRIAGLQRSVSEYVRSNVYVTASGMLNPALLRHAQAVTTSDRLIFSTDYPFQQPTGAAIAAFLQEFPTDEDRNAFAHGSARRLFRLDSPLPQGPRS